MQEFKIVEASTEHFEAISEIHNSHVYDAAKVKQNRFLIAKISPEDIAQQLAKATQYFVALDSQSHVLGLVSISRPHITEEFIQQVTWANQSWIDQILSDRHIYINTLGIHNQHQGKGIAQQLYRSLYQRFPGACFSAFVVTRPVLNERSLAFHEKQGFRNVGTFARDTFLNFQNYASALLVLDQSQPGKI
ncbi:N-acetyltransferase family protein [Leptolyngbya sp. AN02str]|uniref:GNAT family N-acetyltransferase n=1 Tax=Leptolyngbya sp. AN02str TaxID=3423363 RepID=UPI003D312E63